MSLFRDLFTGIGNQHWDLGRFMSAGAFVALVASQFHALLLGQTLNVQDFGLGLAAVLGGAGALIALKDRARSNAEGNEP